MTRQPKSMVPKVRFKGFTDEWEQRKLGDLVIIRSGLSTNTQKRDGLYKITRIETISEGVINENKVGTVSTKPDNKFLMHTGDILFSNINSLSHIGKVAIFNGSFVLYHGMNLLRLITTSLVNPYFIYYELTTTGHKTWAKAHANPAVSQASINQHELSLETMYITSLVEQEQTARLINKLHTLITLQQRKLDQLNTLKKGLLQKMFADKKHPQPELRFKGFSGDWKQRKLGDVLFGFKYGLNTPAIDYDGQNKYLRITDIDDNTHQFMQDKLTSPKNRDDSYLLKSGDILFARTGASVGKTYEYHPEDGKVYYAGFLIKGSTSNNNDASFIFFSTLLNRYIRFVKVTSMRSGQPGINANEYKKYSLYIPPKNEQCRISKLLKKIDAIITLQQKQIDKLNSLKKSLLQNMFI